MKTIDRNTVTLVTQVVQFVVLVLRLKYEQLERIMEFAPPGVCLLPLSMEALQPSLAGKYRPPGDESDVQILLNIVSAAGFEAEEEVPGVIRGLEKEPLYVVINKKFGNRHPFATEWLEDVLYRVVSSVRDDNFAHLVHAITTEVERSNDFEIE